MMLIILILFLIGVVAYGIFHTVKQDEEVKEVAKGVQRVNNFKVGDKVRLNPRKCTPSDLNLWGCRGKFGVTYTIDRFSGRDAHFQGSNYHNVWWLMKAIDKNVVGGKLL